MPEENIKTYRYRWVILATYMLVVCVNQLMWITFAPVTGIAASFYHVSDLSIGLLSMVFMVVYILVSIPASAIIDTYGIRIAVGIGAVLTGIFGLMRGFMGSDFAWVLVSQVGIAIGQPFLLNAMTTVAARWFPMRERATASGLGSLAMYFGIILGMAITPYLVIHSGMDRMLVIYGIISAIAAFVFLVLIKERPPTPAGKEERSLVFDGLKSMLHRKNYLLLLVIFFFGLGVFNAVATWIEDIVRPRGFSVTQAGMAGGLMIFGDWQVPQYFPGFPTAIAVGFLSSCWHWRFPAWVLSELLLQQATPSCLFPRLSWVSSC
jgi:MFS family permease